jgi:hypothetical protein
MKPNWPKRDYKTSRINQQFKFKIMRKVFSSHSELAHVWANQLQNEGRSANMFFNGASIYSYGSHYEIAKFVDAPNGEPVVFINSNGYSSSTGKHTNHVINAIPKNIKRFLVPFFRSSGYYSGNSQAFNLENLGGMIEKISVEIDTLLKSQLSARSNTYHFYKASRLRATQIEICELFNLKAPIEPENWLKASEKATFLDATASDRQKVKEAKELVRIKEHLAKWLNHEFNGQFYNIPIHFRLSKDGSNIETTKGAKVSKIEALKLLSKVRANQDVIGENIGGFTVLGYNDQDITIGCHIMNWDLINSFFAKVN